MRFLLKSFGFYKTRQKCFEIVKYLEFSEKMKICPVIIISEKNYNSFLKRYFFLILGTLILYVLNFPS